MCHDDARRKVSYSPSVNFSRVSYNSIYRTDEHYSFINQALPAIN